MKHHSRLVSVHRLRIPCPVCGKRDNCNVSEKGTYCRRAPSPYQGRDGGWWHPNEESHSRPAPISKPVARVVQRRADRQLIHALYSALLRLLVLLPAHRESLQARGLSFQTIERELFRSTPTEEEAREIAENLAETCDLAGIPGFYKRGGVWQIVKTPSGFFVPIRDRDGLIQGLQIRKDYLRHEKDPRYTWLSSHPDYYHKGTSSGAPVHIQHADRISATGKALITEGALKSIVAGEYLPADEGGLIALAGTSAFRENFGEQLKTAWPMLQIVQLAFDADFRVKREVRGQLYRLARVLSASGLRVRVLTWDTQEKGLDDYLYAEALQKEAVA
jgi:hypothetical protein